MIKKLRNVWSSSGKDDDDIDGGFVDKIKLKSLKLSLNTFTPDGFDIVDDDIEELITELIKEIIGTNSTLISG